MPRRSIKNKFLETVDESLLYESGGWGKSLLNGDYGFEVSMKTH